MTIIESHEQPLRTVCKTELESGLSTFPFRAGISNTDFLKNAHFLILSAQHLPESSLHVAGVTVRIPPATHSPKVGLMRMLPWANGGPCGAPDP